ncbi:hypothetical protein PIB30_009431 [Stylosanthes scabra]|uniref:Uncharacterized protein n=1 Tax=Stylosanthes scabra TaxID=79078 RepID=A0ABU6X3C9_9FABA|nr:hypothetical protein [Stylosanthes scabra]
MGGNITYCFLSQGAVLLKRQLTSYASIKLAAKLRRQNDGPAKLARKGVGCSWIGSDLQTRGENPQSDPKKCGSDPIRRGPHPNPTHKIHQPPPSPTRPPRPKNTVSTRRRPSSLLLCRSVLPACCRRLPVTAVHGSPFVLLIAAQSPRIIAASFLLLCRSAHEAVLLVAASSSLEAILLFHLLVAAT